MIAIKQTKGSIDITWHPKIGGAFAQYRPSLRVTKYFFTAYGVPTVYPSSIEVPKVDGASPEFTAALIKCLETLVELCYALDEIFVVADDFQTKKIAIKEDEHKLSWEILPTQQKRRAQLKV